MANGRTISDMVRNGLTRWTRIAMTIGGLALGAYVGVPGVPAGFGVSPAQAQQDVAMPAKLKVTDESGYARLVLSFPGRSSLPSYRLQSDNGVFTIALDKPVKLTLPDISGALPNYITAARIDPDQKGIRLGLKSAFRINPTEAGEYLFIDFLPEGWTGVLPGLPQDILTELTKRSQQAALEMERRKKAETIATNPPKFTLRVGRNPTFMRLQFDWSMNVEGRFSQKGDQGAITFDMPMPLDLFPLLSDMPKEIVKVANATDRDNSVVSFRFAKGVTPRFYQNGQRQFVLDIDLLGGKKQAVDLASLMPADVKAQVESKVVGGAGGPAAAGPKPVDGVPLQTDLTPTVENVGNTVRVTFPFAQETASAVFRRGDTLWLVFDTATQINPPPPSQEMSSISDKFDVVSSGDTEIVRIKLSSDRLATLASEGRSWVLSLGDVLLSAVDPLTLSKVRDAAGRYSVRANLENPGRIHEIRDPEVGDILDVVTAYPPSRGVPRPLKYVDFLALPSVQGLVVQPNHPEVRVDLVAERPVISAPKGLTVSAPESGIAGDSLEDARLRDGFVDLKPYVETDPRSFSARRQKLMQRAAESEKRVRDSARLELARFYLANEMPYEAIGVIKVLKADLTNDSLKTEIELTDAAALTMAGRDQKALDILGVEDMARRVDALMWRTMARVKRQDYAGARQDALAAEPIISSYPPWVQTRFLLAGATAGIEENDPELANRFLAHIVPDNLNHELLTRYELAFARLDDIEGRKDEALDTYGQVISADVRPTKAEAIYRTLVLLDKMGRLDAKKGAETLAREVMVWRGGELEVKMLAMLARLSFRAGDFRTGFETVREVAQIKPKDPQAPKLLDEARKVFADLYLNGQADTMEPVRALTLYYDFRLFTPPGARGDEMVRNLARRMIGLDLLDQAASLLQYQVSNRLQGAAKAQIAADLAVVYLADRKPDLALKALRDSRLAQLPPGLERQRRVLEARALLDAGRDRLALDLLSQVQGQDADLLRVDADWQGKRYREAGELLERIYAPTDAKAPLSPMARKGIIKAAVAFVLSDEKLGLARLRAKFGEAMAGSPEWPVFNYVTGPITTSSLAFRKIAQQVAAVDSLDAFLNVYRTMYQPDGALAPNKAVSERVPSKPKGA